MNLFRKPTPAPADDAAELELLKLRNARDDAQTRYNRAKAEADRVRANPGAVSALMLQAALVEEPAAAQALEAALSEYDVMASHVEQARKDAEQKRLDEEKAEKVRAYEEALAAYRQAADALVAAAPKVRSLAVEAGVYLPDWQGGDDLLFDQSAEPHILGETVAGWQTV
ncbi:hypothetical protein [Aquitalea magnusonii]|uniref:Uncharacterized protein n=1 Tax=Aquitalea magnusonii TaxID=332411 RepID=A0A318JPD0_9NEIS|nr:hypothetical protein [Aquitalea magnusonii]PXX51039.1 hypothetical protein DFR38_10196 [Aquitalea magnusonii]